MFGSLFSAVAGGLFGGSSKSSTSSSTTTTTTTTDDRIAATDQSKVNQYRLDHATGDVKIESLDGQVALASIAAILDTTKGAVEALQANNTEVFGLVNEQARSGSERLAQSTINGFIVLGVAAAIAFAVASRKRK